MEVLVLSNARYTLRDEGYIAPWFLAFDPRIVNRELIMRSWDGVTPPSRELPDPGVAIPHVSGMRIENDPDPTFNFGGAGMQAPYAQYRRSR